MNPSQPTKRNDVLAVVRRRSPVFLSVFLLVFALSLVALVVIPVRYVATGSVIVAEQTANPEGSQPIGADKIGDPADLESQILLIKASRLLHLALERSDVQAAVVEDCEERAHAGIARFIGGSAAGCQTLLQDRTSLVDQLQQHFSISAVGRSRVITIAFDSPSPSAAQRLVNALTTTFLDERHASWVAQNKTTAVPLKQELEKVSQTLKQDEERIRAFRSGKGLVRGSQAPISSERLSSISQSLVAAEAAKSDAAARLEEIEKAARTDVANSPIAMSNRTIMDLKQQLTVLDVEFARTSATLGPRHPAMVGLQQARDALKARLDLELQSVVAGARKSFETASALTASLRQKMHAFETEAGTAEDEESSIADLLRALETKKARYADLTREITRLEAQAPAYSDTTKLVNLADLPASPYFPKRVPFVLGGLVLALLMAGGATLVADRLDISLKSAAAIGTIVGAPILSAIPELHEGWSWRRRRAQLSQAEVLARARDNPAFRAAIADLIGAMAINVRTGRSKTVLIASPSSGDGRTLTTIALAYGLAALGKRTLIVEADFRNPSIAGTLKLGPTPGLAGLLQSAMPFEAAVRPTLAPTLFVLPAGQRISSATAALAGPRMAQLLDWARSFDYVLIDTPAAGATQDACALAKLADAVVCCVRWGKSDEATLAATVRDLRQAGGRLLGAVMTMVDLGSRSLYEGRPGAKAAADRREPQAVGVPA